MKVSLAADRAAVKALARVGFAYHEVEYVLHRLAYRDAQHHPDPRTRLRVMVKAARKAWKTC